MLAKNLHRAGELDDAEKLYERILEIAPKNADALHFKGVLSHQRGRTDQALELIRASIELEAGVPDWHYNLGNVLFETGRLDDADDAYGKAALLAPDRADIQNNLGVLRRHQGRPVEAEAAFRRALALNPKNPNTHTNLGRLFHALGRHEDAMRCFCEALVLDRVHAASRHALGRAYSALGRLDEAAQVYRDWLEAEPGNPQALHHLAACSGEAVPTRAPDAYVEAVFDSFADSFDAKLAALRYRAPELIVRTVASLVGEPRRALSVLDAGCGTGLCGPLLAPHAKRLVGVDLSSRMLARAESRQVYDTLVKAELTAFIEDEAPASYDLIVSADTLCYFGDLDAVTRAAAQALRPGGWLVFSAESLVGTDAGEAGFHLNAHGRYSHREGYLRRVLADAGLVAIDLREAHLRTEGGKPVEGFVVSAQAGTSTP